MRCHDLLFEFGCLCGQKTYSNLGWRAVNILNKPTIFSELIVVNLQPSKNFLGGFLFLINKGGKNEKNKKRGITRIIDKCSA